MKTVSCVELNEVEKQQVIAVVNGADIGDFPDLFDKLVDFYYTSGEMDYGVAKAKTGDPYNWITEKLKRGVS